MGDLQAGSWQSLCALALMLGCRHGFDADHLVAIDGLTRWHSQNSPRLSRWCGVFFSIGHGTVVLVIAVATGAIAETVRWPQWMEAVGVIISAGFLTALGMVNLYSVCTVSVQNPVLLRGMRGPVISRLIRPGNPWLVTLTGALFAISFDTLSQAALFAALASRYGGWEHALVLGLLFMGGMLLVDGLNGIWVYRLIRSSDRWGLRASRFMGWLVSLSSFAVAGLSLVTWAQVRVS